jgi:hypothetical protein
MAWPELPDPARVRIELEVSGVDAARIDEVVTRPEFAGWTRGEWCVEIIRTALRYYVGDAPAGDRGPEAAGQPVAGQRETPATSSNQTATTAALADGSSPDGPDSPGRPVAAASQPVADPEPVANRQSAAEFQSEPTAEQRAPVECAHPAGARDYETGTCAACGAILWD